MASVQLKNLTKEYEGGVIAVKGVDIEVLGGIYVRFPDRRVVIEI